MLRLGQWTLLALIGLTLGYAMRDARFDDPFITYRFAENLAFGRGFSFNPNESGPLITTAPLYALLLGVLRIIGFDVPTAGHALGVFGLIAGAIGITQINASSRPWLGFLGGLIYLLMPLNWLTVGFETPLFLALVIATLHMVRGIHVGRAGILCGLALGLRGDGIVLIALSFATWVAMLWLERWPRRWQVLWQICQKFALFFVPVYAPLAAFLTFGFGSPLPTTLATKTAQAAAGLTGFYTGTSFPGGFASLVLGAAGLSPFFYVLMLFPVIGLVTIAWQAKSFARASGLDTPFGQTLFFTSEYWLMGFALLHFAGYTALGVAPYVWYYAPLLPGLATALASFIDAVSREAGTLGRSGLWGFLARMLALLYFPVALSQTIGIWLGGTPPPPEQAASKILPETKVEVYRRVGEWIDANTPATATVGFTELGVMSYYADRRAVDFLGLTSPQYRDAIRHGDFVQSVVREQPDFVALSAVNSVYTFSPQNEDWFRQVYSPVAQFDDARFWGTPMTVYHRMGEPITRTVLLDNRVHDLGNGWRVTAIVASDKSIRTGTPTLLRLRLRAGERLGNRTLGVQPVLIAGGDGLPVASRMINTNLFAPGEEAWLDFAYAAGPNLKEGGYTVEAGWREGGPLVRAGTLKVPLSASRPQADLIPLNHGAGIFALAETAGCVGDRISLPITWQGGDIEVLDYTAFVHVRDGSNRTVTQTDGPPRNGTYPTSVWSPGEVIPDTRELTLPAQPGNYTLVAGLYLQSQNVRMPVQPSQFALGPDEVWLGTLSVKACPP